MINYSRTPTSKNVELLEASLALQLSTIQFLYSFQFWASNSPFFNICKPCLLFFKFFKAFAQQKQLSETNAVSNSLG